MLKIVLFSRKIIFCSQNIQDFVILTILWFTKSVTSWQVLTYEIGWTLEYVYWTTTYKVTKLRQLIYFLHYIIFFILYFSYFFIFLSLEGQQFSGCFWTIWRTGSKFQVLFNLVTCSNYSVTNYVKIPMFHF